MAARARGTRFGVGGHVRRHPTVSLLFLVAVLVGFEFITPAHEVSVGSALAVPIVLASRQARGTVLWVMAAAVLSRVSATVFGEVSPVLALVDVVSYGAVGAIVLSGWTQKSVRPRRTSPSAAMAPKGTEVQAEDSLLTAREREVVTMALRGLTAASIGQRLHLSRRTVEAHLGHAYGKLGFRSRQELIVHCFDADRGQASASRPPSR